MGYVEKMTAIIRESQSMTPEELEKKRLETEIRAARLSTYKKKDLSDESPLITSDPFVSKDHRVRFLGFFLWDTFTDAAVNHKVKTDRPDPDGNGGLKGLGVIEEELLTNFPSYRLFSETLGGEHPEFLDFMAKQVEQHPMFNQDDLPIFTTEILDSFMSEMICKWITANASNETFTAAVLLAGISMDKLSPDLGIDVLAPIFWAIDGTIQREAKRRLKELLNKPIIESDLIKLPTFKDIFDIPLPKNYTDPKWIEHQTIDVKGLSSKTEKDIVARYIIHAARQSGYDVPTEIDPVGIKIAIACDYFYRQGFRDIPINSLWRLLGFKGNPTKSSITYLTKLIDKYRSINVTRVLFLVDRTDPTNVEVWNDESGYEVGEHEKSVMSHSLRQESFMFLPITSWKDGLYFGNETRVFHLGEDNQLLKIAHERKNVTKTTVGAFGLGTRLDRPKIYYIDSGIQRIINRHKSGNLNQDEFDIRTFFEKCGIENSSHLSRDTDLLFSALAHHCEYEEIYDFHINRKTGKFYFYWNRKNKGDIKKKYLIKTNDREIKARKPRAKKVKGS